MNEVDVLIGKSLKIKLPDYVKLEKSSNAIAICDCSGMSCISEDNFISFITKEFPDDVPGKFIYSDEYMRVVGNSFYVLIDENKQLVIPNHIIKRYGFEECEVKVSFDEDFVLINQSSRKMKK